MFVSAESEKSIVENLNTYRDYKYEPGNINHRLSPVLPLHFDKSYLPSMFLFIIRGPM